ncbi:MAG TPA: hypothetical protein VN691_11885 [Steroidobacteraceae bacterium]|nr:hypothetical protein [Steroidobacteraceae bacterium]
MILSSNTPAARACRLWLHFLGRPRLISNLLALVALFSIGFV